MKKIYLIASLAIVTIIVLNVLFFRTVKQGQVDYQKDILLSQINKCGDYIEKEFTSYENDLNRIIFQHINSIHTIFEDKGEMFIISRDLENFYAKYRDLITSISVVDNGNKFLGIYINDNDDFVVDTFARQRNNSLEPQDVVKENKSRYENYFPYFESGILQGNIVVEIDLESYLSDIFDLYNIEGLAYQWVLNSKGDIVFSNIDEDYKVKGISELSDSIEVESSGTYEHSIYSGRHSFHTISAYYHLDIINNDLGIVFSMNSSDLLDVLMNRYLELSVIMMLIFGAVVGFLIYLLLKKKNSGGGVRSDLIKLKMILEHFPIGIMVMDEKGFIRMINMTGQKMLFVDKHEELIGKKFDDQFLVSNNYLLEDSIPGNFEKNHFFNYMRDGKDFVIYRKDEVKYIQGEKLTISALMDVSLIDKSRKKEAAANQAKSDFLAKMSHEIRTPMNGIINMTESLLNENLNKEVTEKVEIVQKSADLLLTLINDILDFSKIEAGKMMLEEIPFSLIEEINITDELFKPQAEEKGLEYNIVIKPEVPDRLIGDPFRLRQVISNLLSNAIKFTHEGSVKLIIDIVEKLEKGITLLIAVEDTGIGIDKDQIDTIFGNYNQAAGATSRKFGGTGLGMAISKQLVELMNGEIWIESPLNNKNNAEKHGTRVSFTLDVYSDEKLKKDHDFTSITRFSQITALILSRKKDENDQVHRILDSFGINYNYRIYNDDTIDSAISHIEQKADLYQIIIIKNKPDYDGFAMALQLKENHISSRFLVIMLSSDEKRGNYLKCRNLDIDYYLIKPYDSHEIFDILHQSFPNLEDEKGILDQINRIRSNLKILVAEDNIVNQRIVKSMFKHLGHEVEIAVNGEEAVKMVRENNFDVLFMDLLMPVMDGLTATRKIRETGNNITIIAMTASTDREKRNEAFSTGMNDYLVKPVKVETIKHILIKWFSESLEPQI